MILVLKKKIKNNKKILKMYPTIKKEEKHSVQKLDIVFSLLTNLYCYHHHK